MDAITINIQGVLASCGELAVGDTRSTLPHLTHSQLLGMIASCCGIHRNDPQLIDWMNAWDVISLTAKSAMMNDYQTAAGTLQLNNEPNKNNQILQKSYLTEFRAVAALLPKAQIKEQINEVIERIKRPANPLYIGRKSCPLSSPLFLDYASYSDADSLINYLHSKLLSDCIALVPAHLTSEGQLLKVADRRLHTDRVFSHNLYRIIELECRG